MKRIRRPERLPFYRPGRTPTYICWLNMVQRCTNPRASGYKYYGGSGITVCDRWRKFANFLSDMGERPDGMSIDRIDNSRGYEPGNCRWSTPLGQSRNRRRSITVTLNGEALSLKELCLRHGMPYSRIFQRYRAGWPPERLAEPVGQKPS